MVPFVHINRYGIMNIHIIFCICDMFSKFHVADHWCSLVFPTAWYFLMHQIPWKSARIPPWYFTNYQCEFQPGSRMHSNAPCHTTTEDDLARHSAGQRHMLIVRTGGRAGPGSRNLLHCLTFSSGLPNLHHRSSDRGTPPSLMMAFFLNRFLLFASQIWRQG